VFPGSEMEHPIFRWRSLVGQAKAKLGQGVRVGSHQEIAPLLRKRVEQEEQQEQQEVTREGVQQEQQVARRGVGEQVEEDAGMEVVEVDAVVEVDEVVEVVGMQMNQVMERRLERIRRRTRIRRGRHPHLNCLHRKSVPGILIRRSRPNRQGKTRRVSARHR
jgi:hypothetical protein